MNIEGVSGLSSELEKRYASHLVCTDETELVVEGFPRSGNTFLVDFIRYKLSSDGRRLRIAHHTHSPLNIQMAVMLDKPCLVLCRTPQDAILSFAIYTSREVDKVAREYISFYEEVLDIAPNALFAEFESAVNDANRIIEMLNARYGFTIPLSSDYASDCEQVKSIDAERAAKSRSPEEYIRTVGAPLKEREVMKAELRGSVNGYIEENPEVMDVYRRVSALFF